MNIFYNILFICLIYNFYKILVRDIKVSNKEFLQIWSPLYSDSCWFCLMMGILKIKSVIKLTSLLMSCQKEHPLVTLHFRWIILSVTISYIYLELYIYITCICKHTKLFQTHNKYKFYYQFILRMRFYFWNSILITGITFKIMNNLKKLFKMKSKMCLTLFTSYVRTVNLNRVFVNAKICYKKKRKKNI